MNKEVKEEYINLCHDAFKAKNDVEFLMKSSLCNGYSRAIRDISGTAMWSEIVMAADLSFPEDVPVCAGTPIYSEKQLARQHANG